MAKAFQWFKDKSFADLSPYAILFWIALSIPFTFLISLPVSWLMVPWEGYPFLAIFISPLVHVSSSHLIGNIQVLLAAVLVLYFNYKEKFLLFFLLNLVVSGMLLWLFGQRAIHVGLSGLAVSLCFFVVLGSLFSMDKNKLLLAIPFLGVQLFLALNFYQPIAGVSDDAHICGGICGFFLAILIEFPFKKVYRQ